jgi:hypothetical protein
MVVLVIIGIIAGGATIGIKNLDSGNATASVKRINALIDYVRVQNMSKDKSYYLVLKEESGAFYAEVQYDVGSVGIRKIVLKERLKLKNGSITYVCNPGGDPAADKSFTVYSNAISSVSLELSFIKESGALTKILEPGASIGSELTYVKRIMVSAAGRSYTINLVAATGKHYIE